MDRRSGTIEPGAAQRAPDPAYADGVSSDSARQSVASFLDKLDTVGEGLSIVDELLEALRGHETATSLANAPQATRPVSQEPMSASALQASVQRTHRDIRKHHQDLFSLLRRIAQREIAADQSKTNTAPEFHRPDAEPSFFEPAPQTTPKTLFLGKLSVPPVDPRYHRLARR